MPDRMGFPAISIVVPNYNHAQYLPRCLTALVTQSAPPLEIIVIDDASTDNSLDMIEDFARQHACIRVIRNSTNQGVVAGMNRGVELAQGDYLLFAAADDQLLPGFLEKSVTLLRQHPQAAMCCTIGDWHEVATGLQLHVGVGMSDRPCFLAPAQCVDLEMRGRFYVASHTAIMRKAPLLAAGAFIPELRWHADWFAITVAALRHGVCFVPEPLARFFIYPASYYKTGAARSGHAQVLQRILDLLTSPEYSDVEPLIRQSGALHLFGWPLLRILLRKRGYRHLLTPAFLRKNLWYIVTRGVKRFMPGFIANWYFRLAGYRAPRRT